VGVTDYIACKGPSDSWCLEEGASALPMKQRGLFEIGRPIGIDAIPDGASQTICFGEGADGRWLLSTRGRFPLPALDPRTDRPLPAYNFWSTPYINTTQVQKALVMASVFGTAAHPLNRYPVIETIADLKQLSDCRPSFKNGPHNVSGFRSNHPQGGYFLFADGSSRFVADRIELDLYQALTSIAGGETTIYVD
jgi:hypothetical protein